jgi:tetratricopeptide (TPR) repeat protein
LKPPPTRWDRHFARTLVAEAAESGSGLLKATKGKLLHLFCVEDGHVVHAASNVLEEQLGAVLERRGTLDPGTRAEAERDAKERGVKLARVLLERGMLLDSDLTDAIAASVEDLVGSTLEWSDGDLEWSAGKPRLDGEVKVRLAPAAMIMRQAGRSVTKADALRMRIGAPDVRLQTREAPSGSSAFEPGAAGLHVLAVCDGSVPLPDVVRTSPADELATLRAVYGLLLVGRLDPSVKRAVRPLEPRGAEPELTRDDCLARLAADASDHYRLLGIDYEAGLEQVRDAYYSLARRYHPDRFRSGALADLLPRFETFFTHVTDAYNTLTSPERRSEYDQNLFAGRGKESQEARQSDTAHLAKENYARARVLLEKRRHVEAATFLENAVQLDDTRPEYHLELGIVLTRSGRRRDEAELHIKRAIALAPTSASAHVALAQLLHRQGRLEETRRALDDALRWDAQNAEAQALLSELAAKEDKPHEGGILRGLFRS